MKLTSLAAALMLIAAPVAAQEVKIGVAAEPYPPFTSPDAAGAWVGWEIDLMNAICASAQLTCVVTPVAWDGIIPSLTSGQIDVIMSSMSITAERMETIDFSDKYYNTPTVIMTAKGSGIAATPEGLAGKIIGVQVATVHEAYVNKYFAAGAAEVKVYQTQDEANQDLAAGRVDAVQADSIALGAFVASEAGACCEIVGAVVDDKDVLGLGVGAGFRKEDTELREKFNAAIAAVVADGTYDKITANYFASSIYGE
jgi:polar amino acid transport system substrate-binding protein